MQIIYNGVFTSPQHQRSQPISMKAVSSAIQINTPSIPTDAELYSIAQLRKIYPHLPDLRDNIKRKNLFKEVLENPSCLKNYTKNSKIKKGFKLDIVQAWLDGMPQAEIARQLKITRSAVRQRLLEENLIQ